MDGTTVPEADYLEAFRLKYWGNRDGWAWLFGIVAVLNLVIAGIALVGAAGAAEQQQASILHAVLLLLAAGVGVSFWLGLRFARPGIIVIPSLGLIVLLLLKDPASAVASLFQLLINVPVYSDTRNKLFFRINVSRDKLHKAWHTHDNNPFARAGFLLSLFVVVPAYPVVGLILSIIGLRRVDPTAHPPIGRKGQAIAGIILGSLGTILNMLL